MALGCVRQAFLSIFTGTVTLIIERETLNHHSSARHSYRPNSQHLLRANESRPFYPTHITHHFFQTTMKFACWKKKGISLLPKCFSLYVFERIRHFQLRWCWPRELIVPDNRSECHQPYFLCRRSRWPLSCTPHHSCSHRPHAVTCLWCCVNIQGLTLSWLCKYCAPRSQAASCATIHLPFYVI